MEVHTAHVLRACFCPFGSPFLLDHFTVTPGIPWHTDLASVFRLAPMDTLQAATFPVCFVNPAAVRLDARNLPPDLH
eukprot:NODE_546_length_1304_cov_243.952988_g394_i0.p7 GENE.NODE_546_length_1304_cov_243.952988_g394_i0~~NODE_546_length_1304_cov_243.952988_g394_i0.p7  ORF type:complete len:77 (+),score=6.49 NODE_546_length_1304_cov_243.952988_g394_i0:252-482(+)